MTNNRDLLLFLLLRFTLSENDGKINGAGNVDYETDMAGVT